MPVSQLRIVLVLIKGDLKAILCAHELVKFGWAHRQNRQEGFDRDDFDVQDRLTILILDHLNKRIDDLTVTLSRPGHVASMKNVTTCSSKENFKKQVVKRLDINRLDHHLADGAAASLREVLWCEHINSVNAVALPVIVVQLSVTDEKTVHACLIDEHFADFSALEVDGVIDDGLRVTQGRVVVAHLFLGEKLVLRGEDPQLVILEGDLSVHRLWTWITEGDIFHCEGAVETDLFGCETMLIFDDDVCGAKALTWPCRRHVGAQQSLIHRVVHAEVVRALGWLREDTTAWTTKLVGRWPGKTDSLRLLWSGRPLLERLCGWWRSWLWARSGCRLQRRRWTGLEALSCHLGGLGSSIDLFRLDGLLGLASRCSCSWRKALCSSWRTTRPI